MAETVTNRDEELRRLLTDAIEVQLAALKAGIGFWSEWIEQTSAFVNSATKTLSSINSDEQQTKDMLLELVDAGRASARALTDIPRHTATRFLEELDRLEEKKKAVEATTRKRAAPGKSSVAKKASRKAPKSAAKKTAGKSVAKKTSAKRSGGPAAKGAAAKRRPRPKRAGRVKE